MARIVNPSPAGPTDAAQIAAFEAYIGHPLPADYAAFLLAHNGGQPEPDAFTLRMDGAEQEDVVMCFFPLRDLPAPADTSEDAEEDTDAADDEEDDDDGGVGLAALRVWPLHCAWDDLQSDLEHLYELELDPPLLPIGTDGSSNYFCLTLTGEGAGAVVFLDHETAEAWPLADSLPAFLAALRPRERDDYADEL